MRRYSPPVWDMSIGERPSLQRVQQLKSSETAKAFVVRTQSRPGLNSKRRQRSVGDERTTGLCLAGRLFQSRPVTRTRADGANIRQGQPVVHNRRSKSKRLARGQCRVRR